MTTPRPDGGQSISIHPSHDEIIDSHFENIFKRLRKIDIALDCIYHEINQIKQELHHDQ